MGKVKLTITDAKCRGGYHKTGDIYIVKDICPPLCHELMEYDLSFCLYPVEWWGFGPW